MAQTIAFAAVAASALLIGAALGAFFDPPHWLRGALLGFGAGALVTAVAFELFEEAHHGGGLLVSSGALLAGVAAFVGADLVLKRKFGHETEVGLALVAAVTLDGVPENVALGVTLAGGGSYALLAAIFASNFPEAFGGAASIRSGGGSARLAIGIWAATAALLVIALVGGRVAASVASEDVLALMFAFAAGAVLASIADTIMPEALDEGGPLIAFATAAGFLVAYALSTL